MKILHFSCFSALLAILSISGCKPADLNKSSQPNIIIILTDDMGYSDPSCYGGELQTPAIDRLAEQGIRFTHFHNCGMCVMTRASMMTGSYSQYALSNFNKLPLLSEELKKTGYNTALIGKWHLPGNPMDRGFDHFLDFLGASPIILSSFKRQILPKGRALVFPVCR